MAKKKIVKLTDEQYYKYIMSLKNGSVIKNADGEASVAENLKKSKNVKKD